MTTARTHKFQVGRTAGVARPLAPEPKADDYVPVSAEAFIPEEGGFDPLGPIEEGFAPSGGGFDPSTLDFDPADHTVDEVKAYVEEHPETADAILELELEGKDRSGLTTFLETFNED
jgi:hypothetical protein